MTSVRCPSCDAAVPADASWCSLCFAPLGVAGAPVAAATPIAQAPVDPIPVATAPVMPPTPAAAPAVESILPPVPGVDPWVAAAIAETPVAPAPAPYTPAHAAPAPVVYEPLPLPPAPVAPPVAYQPAPLPPAAFSPDPLAQAPLVAAPVAAAPVAAPAAVATVEAPTWPCTSCGTRVDFAEMTCPSCHTPFMGGVTPDISLKVPGVGDLVHMSSGVKFGVMAGGAAALAGILVLLFLILGHIF